MWKYARIGLAVLAAVYVVAIIVGLTTKHGTSPGSPAPASQQTDANNQLAQLQAQKIQLNGLLAQCVQITVGAQQAAALGIAPPPSQMTPQYCDQMTPQWYAQLATVEAQMNRLQGIASDPCSVSGACNSPGSSSGGGSQSSSSGNGQTPAERYSEQGILGQRHFAGTDGSDVGNDYVLSTQHNYYYRDPASGNIVGTDVDQIPDADHTERLTPE
jgi:hypothetical protein